MDILAGLLPTAAVGNLTTTTVGDASDKPTLDAPRAFELWDDALRGLEDVHAGRVLDADALLEALQKHRKLIFVSSDYASAHNLDINIKCKPSKS